ncbi:aminomethyl-transferring glycine dehydrogenase [Xanthobacteraceae bacterium Astr-EGSB]|uniref:aminomethyl-transferring glycine dehydrogenase n=1 Tax=Astrobacterium formosum TaxID=3069710 RepID=UPI0027AFDDF1|nr:aminomethyl-transferring glycine dehydrogenase [Xanthobacteraceae bacterium Astr-EGSB]
MNAPVRIVEDTPATDFARRHIGPSPRDIAVMLEAVGASSLDELTAQTVPASIRQASPLVLGTPMSETEALAEMARIAAKNEVFTSLIGQGYYGAILPPTILRNIVENPAWYTSYTPYQPEISQGRLEAMLNFQTMIAELTGLDIAGASLLDEATAAAEAMTMAHRVAKAGDTFFVDADVHPQTLAVMKTRAEPLGLELVVGDPDRDLDAKAVFGALFQYPGTTGRVRDLRGAIKAVKDAGGIAAVAADLLALTLLMPPGELGADIAVGSAQRFGVPLGYGGPHAGFMACRDALKRTMPGRLVGVTVDARGNRAYRLALQTREQHIRREKATSNICTSQALLAVVASMYAVYHGPEGLRQIARDVHARTATLAAGLAKLGFKPLDGSFFDTVTVAVGARQRKLIEAARARRINLRMVGDDRIGISLDETTTPAIVEAVWSVFGGELAYADVASGAASALPAGLARTSAFLRHDVFYRYRSETELMRYMRKLADRDLALDRAMIPLGSCTMKLNAAAEMIPLTWAGFSSLHPFVPKEQAQGYAELIERLADGLVRVTGYDAVSLQPNSGAQGELAGLLAIRAYQHARGDGGRNICLIPASAHGTNPASAVMAGFQVVVVACGHDGNVDVADLEAKAKQHADKLAAIMITYPSTHGVFEEKIRDICDIVHAHGGQVYVDGANLNAQVGLAQPGQYGGDVSHLNLHKTFCIPHGGGGPGVGALAVKAHLAPYVPGHPALGDSAVGPVAAAPYGSASILTISLAYLLLMGGEGLTRASQVAILNANYLAAKLEPYFPVLYKNEKGRVAHECIVDPRRFKDEFGVTVDDIAKRLVDYGFHAPTMSFPVPGTLMIEPTESESKAELDRFVDAMIAIRREIDEVASGRFAAADSPLRHAPHTIEDVADDAWARKYTRREGCFPNGVAALDKYWSPVGRVDNAYGDRNLVCACPPMESYAEAAE